MKNISFPIYLGLLQFPSQVFSVLAGTFYTFFVRSASKYLICVDAGSH